ncbi:MAG TPA: YciI family protein [Bacteroidota bacterium]|nr:YciI family protein [Bacteroidota bacterium]
MREFMFFIRKRSDSKQTLSPADHEKFLKGCELYIGRLKKTGNLISAQPIDRNGCILSFDGRTWKEGSFNETGEVVGGYYHILAADLNGAIAIAKENPEFQFNPDTRIEVRPVKTKEETTGYVYPSS